jgi:hypothetical protein
MAETPTLFVCHGDDGGPRMHPCRRVQEALVGREEGASELHPSYRGVGAPRLDGATIRR